MLEEALEHLVKGIVEHPDEVTVRDRTLRRGRILEVRVHPDDLGKVIGRQGRTANALRTVMSRPRGPRRAHRPGRSARSAVEPAVMGTREIRRRAAGSPAARRRRIGRAHGVKGEATIEVRTDDPELRFAPGAVLLTDPPERGPLTVRSGRVQGGRLVLSFEGRRTAPPSSGCATPCCSPTSIRPTAGRPGRVLRPPARGPDGALRGRRRARRRGPDGAPPGAGPVRVRRPDGGELLLPFIAEFVPEVDLEDGVVLVDPPEGLLSL